MGMTDNIVAAGDYKNKPIMMSPLRGEVYIQVGITKKVPLNKETIKTYEIQSEKEKANVAGAVGRGLVGGALLGGAGAVVGAATRKKKSLTRIAVEFNDGTRSLIQMDDKIYAKFQEVMF